AWWAARSHAGTSRPVRHRGCRSRAAREFRMLKRLYSSMTEVVDRRIGWDKLPWPLGMLVLLGIRFRLRARNLYDSGRGSLDRPPADEEVHANHLTARTLDGTYNDLDDPLMGALGSRFGRNVAP